MPSLPCGYPNGTLLLAYDQVLRLGILIVMRTVFILGLAAVALPLFAQTIEFNRDIRPILSDRCFTCHGPDAGHRKAGLRFDVEAGATKAIVPGDATHSRLMERVTTANKARRMPPAYAGKDPLTAAEIALLRRWIEQGARWEAFWSLKPPRKPAAPAVKRGGLAAERD